MSSLYAELWSCARDIPVGTLSLYHKTRRKATPDFLGRAEDGRGRHFRVPPYRFARGGHHFRAAPSPLRAESAPTTKGRTHVAVNLHFGRNLHKFSGGSHSAFHRILHRARKVAADGLTNCGYCITIGINQTILRPFGMVAGRHTAFCKRSDHLRSADTLCILFHRTRVGVPLAGAHGRNGRYPAPRVCRIKTQKRSV